MLPSGVYFGVWFNLLLVVGIYICGTSLCVPVQLCIQFFIKGDGSIDEEAKESVPPLHLRLLTDNVYEPNLAMEYSSIPNPYTIL